MVPWEELALREKLGEGAFGEVTVAEYGRTACAIKRLPEGESGRMLAEHLRAEFDVMMQLRHPHIVQMIGFASDGGANCGILMELMEASLAQVLSRVELQPFNSWEGSLLSIATDACLGMAYLHQQDILHCDLKPANVLISAHWVAKVADFGHAGLTSASTDGGDLLKGTPPYMAPEVVSRRAYAKPVDVWSFGCLMAHMASGLPVLGPRASKRVGGAASHL